MKCTKLFSLLTAAAVTLLPLAALAAQPIDLGAAKSLLRQRTVTLPPVVFQPDASLASCTNYISFLNKANQDFKACMNPDTPTAGSPVAKFNAYTNMQLAQYCGNKTMQQCVDQVNQEQNTFCNQLVMPTRTQAEKAKQDCTQARVECTTAKSKLEGLKKSKVEFEARKKQLEADLAKANADLATNTNAINAASAEVNKQCTGAPVLPAGTAGPAGAIKR